jgi:hypothetical protein
MVVWLSTRCAGTRAAPSPTTETNPSTETNTSKETNTSENHALLGNR